MSCKAAVKGNHRLSLPEVDALMTELLTLENPFCCPHGRPTIISMSKYEIEKKKILRGLFHETTCHSCRSPTAVGKNRFINKTCKKINGAVISADSMQVYKHMDIGSAKKSCRKRWRESPLSDRCVRAVRRV